MKEFFRNLFEVGKGPSPKEVEKVQQKQGVFYKKVHQREGEERLLRPLKR